MWLGIIAIAVSTFMLANSLYMDPDNAWFPIMGRGIAEGNIFLTNWISGTQTFYFPYVHIEAFWALFFKNYQIAHAISVTTLVLLLGAIMLLAIKGLSNQKKKANVFAALIPIVVFTTLYIAVVSLSFAHLAPAMSLIVVAYLYYVARDNKWSKWGIVGLLACWTDDLNYVYFLAPIVLENILYYIKNKQSDPMFKWIAVGMLVYAIRRSLFMDVGIEYIGYDTVSSGLIDIVGIQNFPHKIAKIFLNFMNLFSIIPYDGFKINTQNFVPVFFFAAVASLSVYLHFTSGKKIIKEKFSDKNRFLSFFIISSVSLFALVLFFNIDPDNIKYSNTTRYLFPIFINFLIVFGHWINEKLSNKDACILFIFTCVLSIPQQPRFYNKYSLQAIQERTKLVNTIYDEKLHSGYAASGNALNTNFMLNKNLVASVHKSNASGKIIAVTDYQLNKADFYRAKFDFVITWIDNPPYNNFENTLLNDDIIETFGLPKKTIDIDRLRLYIYDHNISNKIKKPMLK